MRITGLDISGFRAFTGEQSFNLSADVVLLTGANGRGKTSVLDAILWALTGSLPRLESQSDDPPVISLYSDSGQARVGLRLREESQDIELVRSDDGSGSQRVQVRKEEEVLRDEEASHWILTKLWPQARTADRAEDAFARAFTRSVYLQQDLVRQFVEADTNRDRFEAVSELVGAGRIGELNTALDTQRRSWKSKTNDRENRSLEIRRKLQDTKAQLDSLGEPEEESLSKLRDSWSDWWSDARDLGLDLDPPDVEESGAPAAIDEAVKTLGARRRQAKRRVSTASDLLAESEGLPSKAELPDLDSLEQTLSMAQQEKKDAKQALSEARHQAVRKREEQIKRQEEIGQLAALAEIALPHIDGRCPVCQQEHSTEKTREHLQSLIDASEERDGGSSDSQEASKAVDKALRRLRDAEEAIGKSEQELEEARLLQRNRAKHQGALEEWLDDQCVSVRESESRMEAVQRRRDKLRERIHLIQSHIEAGEELSLRLATVAQEARREELGSKIAELKEELETVESELSVRSQASQLADTFVDELEDATIRFVDQRLDSVGSLLQKIYSKVDPHPTFRTIQLISSFSHRRGRLDPYVSDLESDVTERNPFAVMSSSQINVVALSIFLALNLGIPSVPLKTFMLDDPLQSLDDINILGLIDLLRRARGHRQMFLATHDSRLAGLLKRKLRPVEETQETRVLSFLNWNREGPEIRASVVERDESPMRLVAA